MTKSAGRRLFAGLPALVRSKNLKRLIGRSVVHAQHSGAGGVPVHTRSFRAIIASGRVEPLALPVRSPDLNAYSERRVRSAKEECLCKVLLIGERSLRLALSEYVAHYHAERSHQGKDNVLLFPRDTQTRGKPRESRADGNGETPRPDSGVSRRFRFRIDGQSLLHVMQAGRRIYINNPPQDQRNLSKPAPADGVVSLTHLVAAVYADGIRADRPARTAASVSSNVPQSSCHPWATRSRGSHPVKWIKSLMMIPLVGAQGLEPWTR